MTPDEYQEKTRDTVIYPPELAREYLSLGLCSEAGELASLYKKKIRDKEVFHFKGKIFDELGDVLWYVARLCDEEGFSLSEVIKGNITKLRMRKDKGTLGGSGDDR